MSYVGPFPLPPSAVANKPIVTTFTSSGTWTKGAETSYVTVLIWNGGGGGGGGQVAGAVGNGGNGGFPGAGGTGGAGKVIVIEYI